MIDPNVLFMGGPAPLAQGIEIFKQDRQQAIANRQNDQQIAVQQGQLAIQQAQEQRAGELAGRQATEFDLKIQEFARTRQQDHVTQTARQVSFLLDRGDTAGAMALLKKSMLDAQSIPELGGLADDYAEFGDRLAAGDVATVKNQADAVVAAFMQTSAAQSEFNAMTAGLSPADKMKAQRINLGLDPRAITASKQIVMIGNVPHEYEPSTGALTRARVDDTGQLVTAQDVGEMAGTVEQGKAAGSEKGQTTEARRTARIEVGREAATAYSGLVRAMSLLQTVETGGPEALTLRAKQTLGIEGADEAELNYLLATNVLKQLKPTFGAAFTAKEGEALARIEAGFGKNNAANMRIIQGLIDKTKSYARQAIDDAIAIEDYSTAQAIKDAMSGTSDAPMDIPVSQPAAQPATQSAPKEASSSRAQARQRQSANSVRMQTPSGITFERLGD